MDYSSKVQRTPYVDYGDAKSTPNCVDALTHHRASSGPNAARERFHVARGLLSLASFKTIFGPLLQMQIDPMKNCSVLLFVTLCSPCLVAQETGHLQIKSSSGIQIFVDGTFCGTTTAEIGGLLVTPIQAGKHTIKAIRKGYLPQEVSVDIEAGAVFVCILKDFVPKIEVSQEGEQQETKVQPRLGRILIQSLPVDCAITIPQLGVDKTRKEKDKWEASKVPVGVYAAEFSAIAKSLSYKIQVKEDETAHLMVDFPGERIVDIALERQRKRAQELERLSQKRDRLLQLNSKMPERWKHLLSSFEAWQLEIGEFAVLTA